MFTHEDFRVLEVNLGKKYLNLQDLELSSFKTKRQSIEEIIELERIKLENDLLEISDKKDFASFIFKKLRAYISISNNGQFYSMFDDSEKHSEQNPHKKSQKNRHEVSSNYDHDNTITKFKEMEKIIDPNLNSYTEYLNLLSMNFKELSVLSDIFIKKYFDDSKHAKIIEGSIGEIFTPLDEQRSLKAKLNYMKKQQDFRQKCSEYEKLKASFLFKTTSTLAKVAKMLGVSTKHMKKNIIHKEQDMIQNASYLNNLEIIMPKDMKKNAVLIIEDFSEFFNEQIERGKLGLSREENRFRIVLQTVE